MNVIPVIDLLDGQVVHAKLGNRKHYQPIESTICASCQPMDVIQALRSLYPFSHCYIADLNAIQNNNDNLQLISKMIEQHSGICFWVDSGFQSPTHLQALLRTGAYAVLGTESMANIEQYKLFSEAAQQRVVLSLDFKNDIYQGPPELLANENWPANLIVMTLNRVGSGNGPDWEKLHRFRQNSGDKALYAAGGVRNAGDLHTLKTIGISGALLATALHSGEIGSSELSELQD